MPKFFFHVEGLPGDCKVKELASVIDAKCEAARYAGRLLCEEADSLREDYSFIMTVMDEKSLTLFLLSITVIDAPAIQSFAQIPSQNA